jgi:hypothetical protein
MAEIEQGATTRLDTVRFSDTFNNLEPTKASSFFRATKLMKPR